jgi:hypothetical protein
MFFISADDMKIHDIFSDIVSSRDEESCVEEPRGDLKENSWPKCNRLGLTRKRKERKNGDV